MNRSQNLSTTIINFLGEEGYTYTPHVIEPSDSDYKPMLSHLKKHGEATPSGKNTTYYKLGQHKFTHAKFSAKDQSIHGSYEAMETLRSKATGKKTPWEDNANETIKNENMPVGNLQHVKDGFTSAADSHFGGATPQSVAKHDTLNNPKDHSYAIQNFNKNSLNHAHDFLKKNGTNKGSFFARKTGFQVDHYEHGGNHYLVQHEPDFQHTSKISSNFSGMEHLKSSTTSPSHFPNVDKEKNNDKPMGITARAKPMMKNGVDRQGNQQYTHHDGSSAPVSHYSY